MLFRLAFITFALSACSRLDNHIDYIRLVCGFEVFLPNAEFSLYRIHDAEGQTVDLTSVPYEIFGEGFVSVPSDQYRPTSSGCLQIKNQEKFFLRLPLRGEASPTLVNQDGLNRVQLIRDETPPLITLPVTRSNFRSGETLDVRVDEVSRTRFCVEAAGQDRCKLKDGPGLAFASSSFQDFDGTFRIPDAEGLYRLSIVAENRNGLSGLLLQNFTVDSTIPIVEVDFTQAESFLFDGKAHFYLEQGYRLGFRSKSEPLSQVKIEYCLVSSEKGESESCKPEATRVFGVENPEALPPGAWTLLYRATDLSGNRAPGWDRLRILAKSTCTEQELLNALAQPEAITCTELVGDLSINRVAVENYERLRTLVGVSGKISLFESDRETLPTFPNLHRLNNLQIELNPELREIDMLASLISVEDMKISENDALEKLSGFHELTGLRNLTILLGGDSLEIQAFGALKSVEAKLSLDGLGGLKNLGFLKAIQYIDSLSLNDLGGLASLEALKSCVIKNSMELSELPSLKDLQGLESTKILRKVWLSNLGITSLAGFENLEGVEDELTIRDSSELTSLSALRSLRLLKRLTIEGNGSLTEINWQARDEHTQIITIKDNDALSSIRGFDSQTDDAPILRIEGNSELKEISGWANLTQLYELSIKDNESLESIVFAPGLKQLQRSIDIQGNRKLKSLQGFGNLNDQQNLSIVVKADLESSKNALPSYTSPQDI